MHDRRLFVAALIANGLGALPLMPVGAVSPVLSGSLADRLVSVLWGSAHDLREWP